MHILEFFLPALLVTVFSSQCLRMHLFPSTFPALQTYSKQFPPLQGGVLPAHSWVGANPAWTTCFLTTHTDKQNFYICTWGETFTTSLWKIQIASLALLALGPLIGSVRVLSLRWWHSDSPSSHRGGWGTAGEPRGDRSCPGPQQDSEGPVRHTCNHSLGLV